MSFITQILPGVLTGPGRLLVSGGALRSPAQGLRAQVTSRATALAASGAEWVEFTSDQPRIHGAARRLLIEGQRTNLSTNPRFEGAAPGIVGAGGSLPSGHTVSGAGVTVEVVSLGTQLGLAACTLRYSAASAPATITHAFPASGALAANEQLTCSVFMRQAGGSQANISSIVIASSGSVAVPVTTTMTRFSTTRTFTTGGAPVMQLRLNCTAGVAVDMTITYLGPQAEIGAFASSPILPPVGTPAASTRGADLVTAPLSSLAIAGPCTLLWTGMMPQDAPIGNDQGIFQIDDGSDLNLARMYVAAESASVRVQRRLAGVAATSASLGTMTAGTAFRVGMTLDVTGRVVGSFNGVNAVALTGAPTAGLATLRIGSNAAGGASMAGETLMLRALPFALGDAALQAAVAALPV